MPCPNDHRRRSVTIGFRTTPEDAEWLDRLVALSGMTKQEYILERLECEDVTVVPSIKVQKNLRVAMERVHDELSRLADISQADERTVRLTEILADTFAALGAPEPVDIGRGSHFDSAQTHARDIMNLQR